MVCKQFVLAAQKSSEMPPMQLKCMANYIAELSLLNYRMLRYLPSLIAASATSLALNLLDRKNRPWNSTLQSYSRYKLADLNECVRDLHRLCRNARNLELGVVAKKYSRPEQGGTFLVFECLENSSITKND